MKVDYSIYPDHVAFNLKALHNGLLEEKFYTEHEIEEFGEYAMIEAAAPIFMKDWTANGEITEPSFEVMKEILQKTITYAIIHGLKEKKLIDMIEDENGEEVVFLTSAGKKYKEENK
jgi:hypothetical protein